MSQKSAKTANSGENRTETQIKKRRTQNGRRERRSTTIKTIVRIDVLRRDKSAVFGRKTNRKVASNVVRTTVPPRIPLSC